MKCHANIVAALCLIFVQVAEAKPLAIVNKFPGKFTWVKLSGVSPKAVASLAKAKSISFVVTFPRDVKLAKAQNGSTWFTFIVADQGKDWKWNQSKGHGSVPTQGSLIKAGKYTVFVPTDGIPKSILAGKQQTISLGPSASGLQAPTSFSIDSLAGG